jgi:hypothetical protein
MNTEPSKTELKHSIEEVRESISDTLETIADEIKETTDWRFWVRKYPTESMLGALLLGYWIGQKFTPSPVTHAETKGEVNQLPNILGSILTGILVKKVSEFVEGLDKPSTS